MYKNMFFLAFLVHSLTACTIVRYHEVKPMRQSFNETASAANKTLDKVRGDLRQKRVILHSLKKQGANMTQAPYPELNSLLTPLQKQARHGDGKGQGLLNICQQFNSIAKGKQKIDSKSPDYARVDDLKDQAKALMSELEDIVDQYQEGARNFESVMKKYRVSQIDVTKTKSQLKSFLRKLDATISLVRSRGSKAQAFSLGKNQKAYRQISAKLALIERERVAVSKIFERFNKAAATQEKLWVGPGVLAFKVMTSAERRADNIEKIGDEISAIGKNL